MALELESLFISVDSNAKDAASGLEALAASLDKIRAATKGGMGLRSVNNQLERMLTALRGGDASAGAAKLTAIGKAMENISNAAKGASANVRTMNTALRRVPSRLPAAAGVAAGGPSALAVMSKRILGFELMRRAMTQAITDSNAYVENMNLFTVAMGEFTGRATEYAERVQDIIGVDMSDWIRNQGMLMQVAAGFGIAGEKAYTFSKGLTQVAYDISSFFNIPIELAMQKVQAGIAGEIEPMRRLGYAIDQNTLQQVANAHGINMRVTKMNQAQKAELRYVAIMEQSSNAINDMSRTLNTSANQLRVLRSQISQLSRAFGNLLIPAVNSVLPAMITFINVMTHAINAIARFFGFTMPSIDYSGMSGGLSDAAEAAGDLGGNLGHAGGAAKKLKRTLLGFDELNVLQDQAGGGGGGGAGGVGGALGDLGLTLRDYDFLGGLDKRISDVDAKAVALGTTLAGLTIGTALLTGIKTFLGLLTTAAALSTEFSVSLRLKEAFLNTGDGTYLLSDIGVEAASGLLLSGLFRRMGFFSKTAGGAYRYGFAVALSVGAAATIVASYKNVIEDPENRWSKEQVALDLKGVAEIALAGMLVGGKGGALIGLALGATAVFTVKSVAAAADEGGVENLTTLDWLSSVGSAAAAGGLIGFKLTHSATGAAIGAVLGASVSATAIITSLFLNAESSIKPEWGDVTLTQDEINALASELIGPELTANLEIVKANVRTKEGLVAQQEQSFLDLKNTFRKIEIDSLLGVNTLTVEDVEGLQTKIQAAVDAAIANMGQTPIDISGILQLFSSSQTLGGETGAELVANVQQVDSLVAGQLTAAGEALGKKLSDAFSEGAKDIDYEGILAAYQDVAKWLNLESLSEKQAEMDQFISGLNLANLDEESFVGAYSKWVEEMGNARTELESAANELAVDTRASILKANNALSLLSPDDPKYAAFQTALQNSLLTFADLAGASTEQVQILKDTTQSGDWMNVYEELSKNLDMSKFVDEQMLSLEERGKTAFGDALVAIFTPAAISAAFPSGYFESAIQTALDAAEEKGIEMDMDALVESIYADLRTSLKGAVPEEILTSGLFNFEDLDFSDSLAIKTVISNLGAALATKGFDPAQQKAVKDNIAGFFNIVLEDAVEEVDTADAAGVLDSAADSVSKVKKEARKATIPTMLFGSAISNVATGLSDIADTTASPTIDVSDKATSKIASLKRDLKSLNTKVNAKLSVTADVSKTAGAVALALSKVVKGSQFDVRAALASIYRYSLLATGGMPRQGTMFLAGEAGAEMVGKVGNRTGVVNREQISDIISDEMERKGGSGISEATLAHAMAEALEGVEVVCDGDSLGHIAVKSINRYQRRVGRMELRI